MLGDLYKSLLKDRTFMGVPLYKDHSQHVPVHAHMLHTLSRQVHHIGISMRCRFGAFAMAM